MKKSRRMVTRLLSWLLVMTLICTGAPISAGAAKKPKLNKKSVKLKVGKTVKLKLKNNKKKVKWSSANKKIATVNKKGLVKAKKKGKTRIIAKVKKKKYICKVTVLAKNTGDSGDSAEDNGSGDSDYNYDSGWGDDTQVTQTPSDETANPEESPGKTPSAQKTAAPGNTSGPHPGPQITPEPVTTTSPWEIPWGTPLPGTTTTPGENTPLPWGTSLPGTTTAPGENTPLPWGTSLPGTTTAPVEKHPNPREKTE
ncbi:MAG: Ig-like domain-containing protein, partial [Lachnospiraceae bacterium]|nr:Ig-like domain-containing protein [Lachnospiraceae bacterium]